MSDIYETGYGNLFPDSSILSIIIPAIRKFEQTHKAEESQIRILDLGCGIGSNLAILREFENVFYVGLEVSSAAADFARKRIEQMALSERAQIQIVPTEQYLENANQTWDIVIDRASLQHHEILRESPEKKMFLKQLNSALNENGILVSLWAGDCNPNTSIRFTSFVPFEEIRLELEIAFKIYSIKKISKHEIYQNENLLVSDEFLILGKKRTT